MNINLDKDKRIGIIGTVLFHVVLVLILFLVYMKPPDPPRPTIGMEVNLGYSDKGMGDDNPDKPVENTAPKPTPQTQSSQEKVVTQDIDNTININDSKNTKKTNSDEKVEEKEPEKKVNKSFLFTESDKSSNNKSDGDDNTPGNKGKKDGDINSDSYIGSGGSGNISFSLGGRKSKKLLKPEHKGSELGTVVVKIWVDRDGKVTNARIDGKTNTSNKNLQNLALKAAKKATFNSNPNAPENQTGTITYIFEL